MGLFSFYSHVKQNHQKRKEMEKLPVGYYQNTVHIDEEPTSGNVLDDSIGEINLDNMTIDEYHISKSKPKYPDWWTKEEIHQYGQLDIIIKRRIIAEIRYENDESNDTLKIINSTKNQPNWFKQRFITKPLPNNAPSFNERNKMFHDLFFNVLIMGNTDNDIDQDLRKKTNQLLRFDYIPSTNLFINDRICRSTLKLSNISDNEISHIMTQIKTRHIEDGIPIYRILLCKKYILAQKQQRNIIKRSISKSDKAELDVKAYDIRSEYSKWKRHSKS